MTTEYKVTSRHPEDTADGRVFGPGEIIFDLDLDMPHNLRLLDEGRVVSLGDAPVPKMPSDEAVSKAEQLGVNIAEVEGTGKDGRVTVNDVEAAAKSRDAQEGDES